jgi:hypothetical protein
VHGLVVVVVVVVVVATVVVVAVVTIPALVNNDLSPCMERTWIKFCHVREFWIS